MSLFQEYFLEFVTSPFSEGSCGARNWLSRQVPSSTHLKKSPSTKLAVGVAACSEPTTRSSIDRDSRSQYKYSVANGLLPRPALVRHASRAAAACRGRPSTARRFRRLARSFKCVNDETCLEILSREWRMYLRLDERDYISAEIIGINRNSPTWASEVAFLQSHLSFLHCRQRFYSRIFPSCIVPQRPCKTILLQNTLKT